MTLYDAEREREIFEQFGITETPQEIEAPALPAGIPRWPSLEQRYAAQEAQEAKGGRWAWHYIPDTGWSFVQEPPTPWDAPGYFEDFRRGAKRAERLPEPLPQAPPSEIRDALLTYAEANERMKNPRVSEVIPDIDRLYGSWEELFDDIRRQGYQIIGERKAGRDIQFLIATKSGDNWGNFMSFSVNPFYDERYGYQYVPRALRSAVRGDETYETASRNWRLSRTLPYTEKLPSGEVVEKEWIFPETMTAARWLKLSAAQKRRVYEIVTGAGKKFDEWLKEMSLFGEPEEEKQEEERPRLPRLPSLRWRW